MVLASMAPLAVVRRARGVTEEFKGFPLEGDRLWIKQKRTINTSQKGFKKWQTNVMYLIPVEKLPRDKCQLPFSESSSVRIIHLHLY